MLPFDSMKQEQTFPFFQRSLNKRQSILKLGPTRIRYLNVLYNDESCIKTLLLLYTPRCPGYYRPLGNLVYSRSIYSVCIDGVLVW